MFCLLGGHWEGLRRGIGHGPRTQWEESLQQRKVLCPSALCPGLAGLGQSSFTSGLLRLCSSQGGPWEPHRIFRGPGEGSERGRVFSVNQKSDVITSPDRKAEWRRSCESQGEGSLTEPVSRELDDNKRARGPAAPAGEKGFGKQLRHFSHMKLLWGRVTGGEWGVTHVGPLFWADQTKKQGQSW